MRCKRLRAVFKEKEELILPNAKNRPGETARWQMEVIDGVVVKRKNFGIRQGHVTVIPERLTNWVAQKLHSEVGCSSQAALLNEAKATMEVPLIKDAIRVVTSKCRNCSFLRNVPNIAADLKRYNEFNPQYRGHVISWDQMTRECESNHKNMKYWICVDHLTGYTLLFPVEGRSDKDNNRAALIRAINKIKEDHSKPTKVITDGCPINAALVNDFDLAQKNIEIIITTQLTRSKNNIAILDSRTQKLTKFLLLAMNESTDPWAIAEKVSYDHNKLRSLHGYSPKELFTGTCQQTGQRLKIDWRALKERISRAREISRKANNKMVRKGFVRDPMTLVPFSEKNSTYGGITKSPIKLGDIILLSQAYNKNKSRVFWKVVESRDIPEGIDFDNLVVSTIKMDVRKIQPSSRKIWSFNAIKLVIDGNKKFEPLSEEDDEAVPEKFTANFITLNTSETNKWKIKG
jgi:hypothetical protein